ncbi:endonuclease/exonuclease/phosphatase family protein [Ensifer aridi]|uniref:endonuclease/exonuclease/phosphatase family protein n=1 Tax=Ensifer aridi TaxID=1708715 RepID=UPI00358DF8CC
MNFIWIFSAGFLAVGTVEAADLRIATFNTESDADTQPAKVAETIDEIGTFDVLALQEVEGLQALRTYTEAAARQGGRWRFVISESGFNSGREADFLGIIYRSDLFRQLSTTEIHAIRSRPNGSPYGATDWSLRGALVLRLQEISTGSEFQVATVHLKCCDFPEIRSHQAALLVQELDTSKIPTIILGDSNIPIEPGDSAPNAANAAAFGSLTTSAGLAWVVPKNPVKTQCSPQYNSMLDQVYAPAAVASGAIAEIKFVEPSYCDKDPQGYSDHRPILATIPNFGAQPMATARSAQPTGQLSEADAEEREFLIQRTGRVDDISPR